MVGALTVEQIADAAGLTVRQVRYVLEHKVLPGTERASQGHRITRAFTPFESFGIAIAAILFSAGLRRSLVTDLMQSFVRTIPTAGLSRIPLMQAFNSSGLCRINIGDGDNIQLVSGRSTTALWRQISTGAQLSNYEPRVQITVDVGRLRDAIHGMDRP